MFLLINDYNLRTIIINRVGCVKTRFIKKVKKKKNQAQLQTWLIFTHTVHQLIATLLTMPLALPITDQKKIYHLKV